MYVQNRKTWQEERKTTERWLYCARFLESVKNTALVYDSEYRWRRTVSSIPCKTISPSVVLTSPVKFSHPKGDCPVSAYKLSASRTKTSGAHVSTFVICFTTAKHDGTAMDICVPRKIAVATTEQRPSLKTKANNLALERTATDCRTCRWHS